MVATVNQDLAVAATNDSRGGEGEREDTEENRNRGGESRDRGTFLRDHEAEAKKRGNDELVECSSSGGSLGASYERDDSTEVQASVEQEGSRKSGLGEAGPVYEC